MSFRNTYHTFTFVFVNTRAEQATKIVPRRVQHTTKRSIWVIISFFQSTSRVVFSEDGLNTRTKCGF